MRGLVNTKEGWLSLLNKHMKDTQSSKLYATRKHYEFFVDGGYYKVSVQASAGHYSTPREDGLAMYKEVELGYPNFNFSDKFIQTYAESPDIPQDTIYAYVPMDELVEEFYSLFNTKKNY